MVLGLPAKDDEDDEIIGASAGGDSGGGASWEVLERGARHRCGDLQYGSRCRWT